MSQISMKSKATIKGVTIQRPPTLTQNLSPSK